MNLPTPVKKYNVQIKTVNTFYFLKINMRWYPEGDHKFGILGVKKII